MLIEYIYQENSKKLCSHLSIIFKKHNCAQTNPSLLHFLACKTKPNFHRYEISVKILSMNYFFAIGLFKGAKSE